MRRKVGDRVRIKSRYFCEYEEMEGTIVEIFQYHEFTVKLDNIDDLKVFYREELCGLPKE